MSHFFSKYRLFIFLIIAFAIATPSFLYLSPETPTPTRLLLLLLAGFSPTISLLIVVVFVGDAQDITALRQRLNPLVVPTPWWLAAIGVLLIVWLAAQGIGGSATAVSPPYPFLATLLFTALAMLGEEIGWRGFALPGMLHAFPPLGAGFALGIIWGIFHLPLIWEQELLVPLFMVAAPAIAILLTWLYLNTRENILIGVVFHTAVIVWAQFLLNSTAALPLAVATAILLWALVGLAVLRSGVGLTTPETMPDHA